MGFVWIQQVFIAKLFCFVLEQVGSMPLCSTNKLIIHAITRPSNPSKDNSGYVMITLSETTS